MHVRRLKQCNLLDCWDFCWTGYCFLTAGSQAVPCLRADFRSILSCAVQVLRAWQHRHRRGSGHRDEGKRAARDTICSFTRHRRASSIRRQCTECDVRRIYILIRPSKRNPRGMVGRPAVPRFPAIGLAANEHEWKLSGLLLQKTSSSPLAILRPSAFPNPTAYLA